MKKFILIFVPFILAGCSQSNVLPKHQSENVFQVGGDLSFLPEIEFNGGKYYDGDQEKDAITLLKDHGFNSVRVKIWHTPEKNFNTLERVAAMAKRIYAAEMTFMLDFHYSDWWADPGKQIKPKAWNDLSFDVLKDSMYTYTRNVLTTLKNQNTLPHIVQIGNEIRPGLLWPEGRIGGEYETPEQWDQLVALLEAGKKGIVDAVGSDSLIDIMIHYDNGGDNNGCRHFYDNLQKRNFEFDLIGLSFYPKWHGTLDSLKSNLADLTKRYDKDVIVVETAYPWSLNWTERGGLDNDNNIFGMESDIHSGYPPTIEGQTEFFKALIHIIRTVPGGRGIGVYYWEPEWISVEGLGSHWENAALFDFEGRVLPSIDAFTGREK